MGYHVFILYPKETIGYTFYHRSEGKIFVAKNGTFLKKEFLSKEVSARKVELDGVTVPSLELESSSSQKTVPVVPTVGVKTGGSRVGGPELCL